MTARARGSDHEFGCLGGGRSRGRSRVDGAGEVLDLGGGAGSEDPGDQTKQRGRPGHDGGILVLLESDRAARVIRIGQRHPRRQARSQTGRSGRQCRRENATDYRAMQLSGGTDGWFNRVRGGFLEAAASFGGAISRARAKDRGIQCPMIPICHPYFNIGGLL